MTGAGDTETKTDGASEGGGLSRSRTQMIGIMMVGFVTLAASHGAFYLAKNDGVWGTTNNGQFVTAGVTTSSLGWSVEGDQRRWWLWMVTPECPSSCQAQVKRLQALHKLLNRDMDRLRRGYTGGDSHTLPQWRSEFPGLATIDVASREGIENGLYIVDPNGNLVFHYPLDVNPKLVLQDLKKLLKVSQIG